MITPAQQYEQERSRAGDDLLDISALKNSTPFKRYWMRHLTRKRDDARESVLHDTLSHEEREIRRRIMLAYEELLAMPDKHETAAHTLLNPAPKPDGKIEAEMHRITQRAHAGHT